MDLFEKLHLVTNFHCNAVCRRLPPSFEPRKGAGEVKILRQTEDSITLFEKGKWQGVYSKDERLFSNVFRFQKEDKGVITLQHFRLGRDKPQKVFTLTAIEPHLYKSLKPHEDDEDTHFGNVLFDTHFVQLSWRKVGSQKNELHTVVYS
ncbi:MAG: hypothetical protein P0S96_05465 [Simkaniaceae bacterium]|nr:hypothetical protein [Candidatus Sacchlamyda saccharinae]